MNRHMRINSLMKRNVRVLELASYKGFTSVFPIYIERRAPRIQCV